MKANKMDHPNAGVQCRVHACYYYMHGDHCCADRITVEPKAAATVRETGCATFTKRE